MDGNFAMGALKLVPLLALQAHVAATSSRSTCFEMAVPLILLLNGSYLK